MKLSQGIAATFIVLSLVGVGATFYVSFEGHQGKVVGNVSYYLSAYNYTCVWFNKENSAVLIPVHKISSGIGGIDYLVVDTDDDNVEDYVVIRNNSEFTSYDAALAYIKSELGEDAEIIDYSDYLLEKHETEDSLEEDTKTYVKSM